MVLASLALASAASASCGRPCPAGRFCGAATWVTSGDEPIIEGTSVVLVANGASDPRQGAFVEPEQLDLEPRSVFVRFDLAPARARGTSVERATLLLSPHPRWSTAERSVRVAVHALASNGAQGNEEPALASDIVSTATVPLHMRAPIRMDVTRAVRAWWDGSLPSGGLAISADGTGLVVQGAAAAARSDRPRLEVIVR
ncbi:MAG: DNRLRE domain-containing protein [Myxococcales bacterium]|nr:DNRLRE domain-containing protein [Myxococcales bacterium]